MIESEKNNSNLMNDLVPSEFYLSHNYPNPFKNKTSIKYCLPEKTKVELTIFNSNGEKVKELVSKVQNAGTYETKFNAQDLPEGVYYCHLKAVDPQSGTRQLFDKTKQMVLQK